MTPIRNQWVYEIPEIPYDQMQLRSIMSEIEVKTFDSWAVHLGEGRGWKYEDARADDWLAIPYVASICQLFNPDTTEITDIVFNYIRPSESMKVHTDFLRNGALMFQVLPDPPAAPIYWTDEQGERTFQHSYRLPTLTQTKLPHGVINDDRLRVTFQISFKQVFEELIDLHQRGMLYRTQ